MLRASCSTIDVESYSTIHGVRNLILLSIIIIVHNAIALCSMGLYKLY